MIIIVEGLDNTGKSTLIKNIRRDLLTSPKTISLHCSSPPANSDDTWHEQHYANILSVVRSLNDDGWDVIMDRSHIGECVYGPLYRNIQDVSYIYQLEGKYLNTPDCFLILLTDNVSTLISRDDGFSPSTNVVDLESITKGFIYTYNTSIIRNKLHYDISLDGGFDNLFTTVKGFINNAND